MTVQDLLDLQPHVDRLAALYGDLCDKNDWAAVAGLFTPDGVFDAEGTYGRTVTGREEIAEFFSSLPSAVAHHPTSSYIVGPADGDGIEVRMKMLVLFPSGIFSVDYAWTVVEHEGEHRIARQRIEPIGNVRIPKPA